jgi:DNA-binding IscR family transcriptional regulator
MAVHVMTVLAYKKQEPVTSRFLAASVNTNPVVIRRLLLALQAARLVTTRRGAGFGSRLTRAPGRIDLAQIYRAVETEAPFAFPRGKPNQDCPVGQCIQEELREVFLAGCSALEREFGKTTLADIVGRVRECCEENDE